MKIPHLALAGVLSAGAGPALHSATPESACDRACLKLKADEFIAALLRHDPSLLPLADGFRMTQDAQPSTFAQGVWSTAVKFHSLPSQTQYVMDTDAGQVGYLGILDDGNKGPAFFALRLRITGGRYAEAEMLVTHRGDATPFWPQGYLWREAPYIREVPLAVRSSRAQLLAATNAYWRVSATSHDGAKVPYSVDCWHFQNGMNTDWERPLNDWEVYDPKLKVQRNVMASPPQAFDGRIWTCAREAALTTLKWTAIRGTRQIVDVERGLVMSWNLVDIDPAKLPQAPRNPDGSRMPSPEGFYGPPSGPGDDGMPLPANSGLGTTKILTNVPYATYQTYVFRVVGGRITREQVFQRFLPLTTPSPF